MKVLITDLDLGDPTLESDWLRTELGADVHVAQCRTEEDVLRAVRDTTPDALIVQWAPITAAVMAAMPQCQVISRVGIGLDMIDLDAAAAAGISVQNVPHYCVEEVATHAVALALSLWRRLPQLDAQLRSGGWDAAASAPSIRRLSECEVGLIGYGRIGRLVAAALTVWGATVIVHDPFLTECEHELVSLDELMRRSAIISVHAPLTAETHHLLGARAFAAAAQHPVIVNASRGAIIDTVALAAALASGQVSAAGIDVFEHEPLAAEHPLRSAPNTVLTPHAAWCSDAALPALRRGAVDNVVRHFAADPEAQ